MELVLSDVNLASMVLGTQPYGFLTKASIAIKDGMIEWVGPEDQLPQQYAPWPVERFAGRLVTPALIDCHTHMIFGGNRAREFELRLKGATYEEVARAGGGILSTVQQTRDASIEELSKAALPRLDHLIAEGVGTVEIKSGYGLDMATELNMLKAARDLGAQRDIRIRTSFLGAHAVPPEFEGRADDYITFVCNEVLPAVQSAGLADAVDGFCEGIAFAPDQIRRVFEDANRLNLPIKLHAEQLSNLGGAVMAAQMGALSVDHLEYLSDEDAGLLAKHETVAVLLPGAFYTLRETQHPPIDALRRAGVPIAIATDCNPGSSPLTSPLVAMNMACTLFRLTPEEALAGATRNAARALGLGGEIGTLEFGKAADLAIWDADDPAELAYRIGFNPLYKRIIGGQL